jgi:hypothetical protein
MFSCCVAAFKVANCDLEAWAEYQVPAVRLHRARPQPAKAFFLTVKYTKYAKVLTGNFSCIWPLQLELV